MSPTAPLLAAESWPIFSMLSAIFSRLHNKNLADLMLDLYGFHHHKRESTRTIGGKAVSDSDKETQTITKALPISSVYDLLGSLRAMRFEKITVSDD